MATEAPESGTNTGTGTGTDTGTGTLEIAHVMPGRLRLRWRGEGDVPPDLLARLRAAANGEVSYRPASRSLLVTGADGFDVEDVRRIAAPDGVDVVEPAPPAPTPPKEREVEPVFGAKETLIKDLEALLLLIVMLSWIRDLVVNRVFRTSTILLVILTAIDLYRYWLRRQKRLGLRPMEALMPVSEAQSAG